jgi:hypothetical protein
MGLLAHDTLIWQQDTYYATGPGGSGQDPQYHYTFYNYLLKGDTTIGATTYQKLYRSTSTSVPDYGSAPMSFYKFLLCDSNKVYMGAPNSMSLILDFNLQIGDSFFFAGYSPKIVLEGIDSVLIAGAYRKRFIFQRGIQWIEKIGDIVFGAQFSNYGFFYPAPPPLLWTGAAFRCYSEDYGVTYGSYCSFAGIRRFEPMTKWSIFPNPTTEKIWIKGEEFDQFQIHDLCGNLIIASTDREADIKAVPDGIYFISIMGDYLKSTLKIIIQH